MKRLLTLTFLAAGGVALALAGMLFSPDDRGGAPFTTAGDQSPRFNQRTASAKGVAGAVARPARQSPGIIAVFPETPGAVVDDVLRPAFAVAVDPRCVFSVRVSPAGHGVTPKAVLFLGRRRLGAGSMEAVGGGSFTYTPAGPLTPGLTYRLLVSVPGGAAPYSLVVHAASDSPSSIAVFDHDLDGRDEILTLQDGGTRLVLHRNTGGLPLEIADVPLSGRRLGAFCVTPTGKDRRLFLLGSVRHDGLGYEQGLSSLLGFSYEAQLPGTGPTGARVRAGAVAGIAAGDITGDGAPDVVVADFFGGVEVLAGDGRGAFAATEKPMVPDLYPGIRALLVEDVDADGDADLILVRAYAPSVLLLSNGRGRLALSSTLIGTGADAAQGAALLDLDRDGRLDLFFSCAGGPNLFARGRGYRDAYRFDALSTASLYNDAVLALEDEVSDDAGIATADFNRDGVPDIALASPVITEGLEHGSRILYGRRGGGIARVESLTFEGRPIAAGVARVVDYGGDSLPDLFLAGQRNFYYIESRRLGPVAPPAVVVFHSSAPLLRGVDDAAFLDADGDGDMDLLATRAGGSPAMVLLSNTGVPGEPLKRVKQADWLFSGATLGAGPREITVFDADGDGDSDVLLLGVTRRGANIPSRHFLLINLGGAQGGARGMFRAGELSLPISGNVRGVLPADLDADGDTDLVLWGPDSVVALLWTAGGLVPTPLAVAGEVASVACADINGDGLPDVIAATRPVGAPAEMALFLTRRSARARDRYHTEASFVPLPRGVRPTGIRVARLDADNRRDVLISAETPGGGALLALWGNRLAGGAQSLAELDRRVLDFALVDADDDADTDVALVLDASRGGRRLLLGDGDGRLQSTDAGLSKVLGTVPGRRLRSGDIDGDLLPDYLDIDAKGTLRVIAASTRKAPR